MGNKYDHFAKSGKRYTFDIFDPYATQWHEVAGVYIFLKPSGGGGWTVLYVGETENFRKRMPPCHERWDEAKRLGATAIAATLTSSISERLGFEAELIKLYQPSMNELHKGIGGLLG